MDVLHLVGREDVQAQPTAAPGVRRADCASQMHLPHCPADAPPAGCRCRPDGRPLSSGGPPGGLSLFLPQTFTASVRPVFVFSLGALNDVPADIVSGHLDRAAVAHAGLDDCH